LSGIATCRGDSRRFPMLGDGCDSFQDGPPSQVNFSCFSSRGMIRIGAGCGSCDEDALGGEGSISGESSFCFLTTGDDWNASHSGGVGLSLGNVLKSGCLGNRGVVRLGVIETMRGSSDDNAARGDGCGVALGMGGISHGRGMRSSDEGPTCLIGGSGISSGIGDLFHGAGMIGVAPLDGGDLGNNTLVGSGVSFIGMGG